jgi:hypothetical protein
MDEVSALDVTGAANATKSIQCTKQGSFMEEETEEMITNE